MHTYNINFEFEGVIQSAHISSDNGHFTISLTGTLADLFRTKPFEISFIGGHIRIPDEFSEYNSQEGNKKALKICDILISKLNYSDTESYDYSNDSDEVSFEEDQDNNCHEHDRDENPLEALKRKLHGDK
ncbi:hypothetical protein [Chitinophaga cymbidii]|uniref:Uncharacterized protein n=1 Tax=Chitinophaga cymbidii TaxID=1096750 RepID=A0A512RIM5_9BACT|nr:hypothetical protein [Chitinophaga cymbidii]GEP95561.1 hypothetical protein CCY01nite_18210 [Chitinophaga cymbidii]